MKTLTKISLLAIAVTIFATCEKFEVNPITKLSTEDATPAALSIEVTGKVIELSGNGNDEYGFCYATHNNPTIADGRASAGTPKVGSFSKSIEGLTTSTTIYFRAYCQDAEGVVYGDVISRTTLDGEASITTTAVSAITPTTAESGGNITDDGGAPITARGVCWSTSENPTTDDYHTSDGSGTGSFTSNITGLSVNTEYNVRSYATNSTGTVYGNEQNFTTLDGLPNGITTTEVTDITATTANSGGNINDDGGFAITARGVCWSTSTNPTISDAHTNDDSGTGSFTSSLTGLTEWSTYYVRAYASNSNGTAYGDEVSFIARNTITDYDGNIYGIVTIGSQIWMAENLKTTHYADGTAIPLVTDNTAWANLGNNNTDDAYCYYNNDANSQYGALYTWAAAMNGAASSTANPSGIQGVCPDGWHLPSDVEWTELADYLGGASVAGGKMKETGTTHWTSPNTGATNETNFTALPGGYRTIHGGLFNHAGNYGCWWSSTETASSSAYNRWLGYIWAGLEPNTNQRSMGFSVRCLKD